MKQKSRRIIKWAVLALPLILGTAGFLLAHERFLNALFFSLCLYTMNISDPPPNFLVELGRWTAPLATASGVFLAFSSLRQRLRNAMCYRRGDSVAVYGPEGDREALLAQLGRRGINGGDRFVRAARYVLLGEEAESFAFYHQNREKLRDRVVYLRCSTVQPQSVADPSLRLFSPEETAGRLFWKEHCLYETSVRSAHQMQIVLLGFDRLGQELLLYALQDNIFDPGQRIEYHVFGDGAEFSAVHRNLGMISDPVIFHSEPWYESLSLLESATAVLVTEQREQTALVSELLLATNREKLFVFTADRAGLALLSGQERLIQYPWTELIRKADYILGDVLYDRAKRINLRYAHLYGGVAENAANMEAEWRKLDGFTRYSNISSADYHEIRLLMLATMGEAADPAQMSPACLELLAQLEHIRWCRYHWLNNWHFGVPEDGRRKDAVRRIHADLIPYGQLTEGEKAKNRETVGVMLGI